MTYVYACEHCGSRMTLRRPIDLMDSPVVSLCCGADATRVFTVTSNIHIPASFRTVNRDGSVGGGQLSWSDFHDETEKELARAGDFVPVNQAMSQPGRGLSKRSLAEKKAEAVSAEIDRNYMKVKQRAEAQGVAV